MKHHSSSKAVGCKEQLLHINNHKCELTYVNDCTIQSVIKDFCYVGS